MLKRPNMKAIHRRGGTSRKRTGRPTKILDRKHGQRLERHESGARRSRLGNRLGMPDPRKFLELGR
eukprot:5850848-Pyramimonas_sp.AAC.1